MDPNQPQPYQQQPPEQPYPAPGYYYQPPPQPYPPQVYYAPPAQPQPAVVRLITRPPFPHGKHIKWSIYSLLLWAVTGYPICYLAHRFGPTKAVTTGTFG